MKNYELIDDPLCDVEGFDSYENCEDCPYFYECMEVKEDENSECYDAQELLEKGYHFINGEPVMPPDDEEEYCFEPGRYFKSMFEINP